MHSERECLLAAVAANPDADLPRLVYADWLEERGEAVRAHFIRLQVAEWRDPEPWELSAAPRPSSVLADGYRHEWLSALPANQRPWVRFERGFAETLSSPKMRTGFLRLLERPHGELATVRRAELYPGARPRAGDTERVATSPGLARLRELVAVAGGSEGLNTARIAASPRLTNLASLTLTGPGYRSLPVPAPESLGLRRLVMSADLLVPAGPPPTFPILTDLELTARVLNLSALRPLLRGELAPNLSRLWLHIPGVPARQLVADLDLPNLRHLALGNHGPEVAEVVRLGPLAPRLKGLSFAGPRFPLATFARLVESPTLPNLTRLDMLTNCAADALADYLLNSDAALRLDKLCVGIGWAATSRAGRLREKYGAKLSPHTDRDLAPTLRRLGRW